MSSEDKLSDGTNKAAGLALEAMKRYGGVLDTMRPFDSPEFSESLFWEKVEARMKELEEHRAKWNSD